MLIFQDYNIVITVRGISPNSIYYNGNNIVKVLHVDKFKYNR